MPTKEYVGTAEIAGITTNTQHRLANFYGNEEQAAKLIMQHNPELKNLRVRETLSTDEKLTEEQLLARPAPPAGVLPPGFTRAPSVPLSTRDMPSGKEPTFLQPVPTNKPAVPAPMTAQVETDSAK